MNWTFVSAVVNVIDTKEVRHLYDQVEGTANISCFTRACIYVYVLYIYVCYVHKH